MLFRGVRVAILRAVVLAAALSAVASASAETTASAERVASPNGRLVLLAGLGEAGRPYYEVRLDGATVVEPSSLGLYFASRLDLVTGFSIDSVERSSVDTTWEQPWGERRLVRDAHNELLLRLSTSAPDRLLNLRFRVFDDGIGFRYEVPQQPGYSKEQIVGEDTEFRVSRDARAFSQPADAEPRYEHLYAESPVGVLDKVSTPLTLRLDAGVHLSIHEAALVDYPAFSLEFDVDSIFRTFLRPAAEGYRALVSVPFETPWRTIQVADTAAGLVDSTLILNLNEPNRLGDVSWVEPGKYVGIWWAMHRGDKTWEEGDRHGATTAEAKRYIDFAAEHGFAGVLIEGWNRGWQGDWVENAQFSWIEATEDFDLDAVAAYAKERGVRLIGHHETGGHASAYELEMAAAFDRYADLGVHTVKTGYVGPAKTMKRIDAGGEQQLEWHDGQWAVQHYQRVLEAAAERRIAINTHEPVKDTGLRRTYPNWLTREGSRGMEFNAWALPNPPDHEPMLVFTRMLAGPMDYTPGIVELAFIADGVERQVQSTLARQLALYVVLYSPVQMVADLPENYAKQPDALRFIKAVPTDWEDSRALAGEVGGYAVIARKDRNSSDWYLGAITDGSSRRLSIRLDFLEPGEWIAERFADGPDADYRRNPYDLAVTTARYRNTDTLDLALASGGGTAIRFRPGGQEE